MKTIGAQIVESVERQEILFIVCWIVLDCEDCEDCVGSGRLANDEF